MLSSIMTRPDTAARNKARALDLTSQRYGRLVVIERSGDSWLCLCDCGRTKVTTTKNLRSKKGPRSCGCLKREANRKTGKTVGAANCRRHLDEASYDHTGERFGRLTVIKRLDTDASGYRFLCRCDCGAEIEVSGRKLRAKLTQSCGCFQKEVATENILAEHWRRITQHLPEEGELYVDTIDD